MDEQLMAVSGNVLVDSTDIGGLHFHLDIFFRHADLHTASHKILSPTISLA